MDKKDAKQAVSRVALGLAAMFAVSWCWNYLLADHFAWPSLGKMLVSMSVLYILGLMLFQAIIKPLPDSDIDRRKPEAAMLPCAFLLQFAAIPCMGVLTALTALLTQKMPETQLDALSPEMLVLLLFFAPIMEERVFRKLIADKLLRHGERVYILTSASCFAAVHSVSLGLPQVAYTFVLGLVWAYVYAKTGDLRWPILLHALSNLFGGVIAQALQQVSPLLATAYSLCLMLTGAAAMILYFTVFRKKTETDGQRGLTDAQTAGTVFSSVGILFYIALTAAVFICKAVMQH